MISHVEKKDSEIVPAERQRFGPHRSSTWYWHTYSLCLPSGNLHILSAQDLCAQETSQCGHFLGAYCSGHDQWQLTSCSFHTTSLCNLYQMIELD